MCKVNGEEDELKEHLEYACMAPRVPQGLLESYHWCQQAGTPPGKPRAGSCRRACGWRLGVAWLRHRERHWAGRGRQEALARCRAHWAQGWKKGGEFLPGPHCGCSAFFPSTIHCFWGEGESVIREKPDPEGRGGSALTCRVFSWKPQNAHDHWRS